MRGSVQQIQMSFKQSNQSNPVLQSSHKSPSFASRVDLSPPQIKEDPEGEYGTDKYVDALQKSLILEQNIRLANQTMARLDQL